MTLIQKVLVLWAKGSGKIQLINSVNYLFPNCSLSVDKNHKILNHTLFGGKITCLKMGLIFKTLRKGCWQYRLRIEQLRTQHIQDIEMFNETKLLLIHTFSNNCIFHQKKREAFYFVIKPNNLCVCLRCRVLAWYPTQQSI